ncbi:hypothetical protein C8R43DRAFT_949079 [Mycena crocata]|nr:hypothetical protein C8R43DRAFT_949079 [Mycena crocata]
MAPRRSATIKKNETPEQWRLKLLNATEEDVIKEFGYEDLKEWHEVQQAEDARIEEEAKKERLRLEKLKEDERSARRKRRRTGSGKRRRPTTRRMRCSNCIRNDSPSRKIKCDAPADPAGPEFDSELFQYSLDAQEDSADSLNAILACQSRIEKTADIVRESLEDLRAIAIRLAFPEQAGSELAAYEERVAKDNRRETRRREKRAETKAERAERGAGGAAVAPEKRTTRRRRGAGEEEG